MSTDEHVGIKSAADIILDTIVYGGHTTLADMLWASVPACTMSLDHMATRIGGSLLRDLEVMEGLASLTRKEFEDTLHQLS